MSLFKAVPLGSVADKPNAPTEAYKNDEFLVQIFRECGKPLRITVNKIKRKGNTWADGITWDELMHIKRMIGFRDKCAVEIYPPDNDIVNVANMRHLWIVDMPDYAWKLSKD